jgi:hypothetical protein
MTASTTAQAPTPGYNHRLDIWFQTDKRGRKTAYRWCYGAFRAVRIPLDEAEIMAATGTASVLDGHPFRP